MKELVKLLLYKDIDFVGVQYQKTPSFYIDQEEVAEPLRIVLLMVRLKQLISPVTTSSENLATHISYFLIAISDALI